MVRFLLSFVANYSKIVTSRFCDFIIYKSSVVFSFGFWVANQFFSKNTLIGSDVEAGKKLIEMNITLDSLTEILEAKDNY
ncbi:MAG: hypothetical protein HC817_10015, partial [Saprospiraceae bacterium]|nr:hypothetical protein [Saprospiraceae bacterium]